MNHSETVQLASGECAILESVGKVSLRLANGTAEIAGRSLSGNETCTFRSARQGIHFYSLEGGSVIVAASSPVHIVRSSTPIPSLGPLLRTVLSVSQSYRGSLSSPGARVLVLGAKSSGKTLAARTFVHLLFRDAITQRRGSSSIENVTLVCGDPMTVSDTCLAPGCVSAVRIARPGIAINTPFLENAHVTFFKAAPSVHDRQLSSDNSSSANRESTAQSLHWLSQAIESSNVVLGSAGTVTVVDAPSFSNSSFESTFDQSTTLGNNSSDNSAAPTANSAILENFYSNLIDIVDPSLILFVGGVSSSTASSAQYNNSNYNNNSSSNFDSSSLTTEAKLIKSVIDRRMQTASFSSSSPIEFIPLEPFVPSQYSAKVNKARQQQQQIAEQKSTLAGGKIPSSSPSSLSDSIMERIEDYFCGTPELPMKCAKLVVRLNKIVFLTISKNAPYPSGSGVGHGGLVVNASSSSSSSSLAPHRVDAAKFHRELVGRVCAVSLAAVEAETAFANVAGLVLIESIDVAENEVVLFAPAGGSGPEETCLVRPFLLVGDSRLTYLNHSGRGMNSVEANSI